MNAGPRRFTALAAYLLITAGVCALLLEGLLRVAGWQNADPDFFCYVDDPQVGVWMADPAKSRPHINAFGMYDRPRTIARRPGTLRIAILGDSFMNGVHAGLGNRLSDLLEQGLAPGAEVLNFGISSVGTVQELLIFRHKVRQFKPDLVILGLLTMNDIRNNSLELERATGYGFQRSGFFAQPTASGYAIRRELAPERNGLRVWLGKHSRLYQSLWKAKETVLRRMAASRADKPSTAVAAAPQAGSPPPQLFGRPWPGHSLDYGVYGPPMDPAWEQAWKTTEHFLSQIREEVEADGAQFVLLLLADPVQIDEDARASILRETGTPPPADFDPDYPNARLEAYARSQGMAVCNLLPPMRAFARSHALPPPYFSFANDGHWSPLGHQTAAQIALPWLKKHMLRPQAPPR